MNKNRAESSRVDKAVEEKEEKEEIDVKKSW